MLEFSWRAPRRFDKVCQRRSRNCWPADIRQSISLNRSNEWAHEPIVLTEKSPMLLLQLQDETGRLYLQRRNKVASSLHISAHNLVAWPISCSIFETFVDPVSPQENSANHWSQWIAFFLRQRAEREILYALAGTQPSSRFETRLLSYWHVLEGCRRITSPKHPLIWRYTNTASRLCRHGGLSLHQILGRSGCAYLVRTRLFVRHTRVCLPC